MGNWYNLVNKQNTKMQLILLPIILYIVEKKQNKMLCCKALYVLFKLSILNDKRNIDPHAHHLNTKKICSLFTKSKYPNNTKCFNFSIYVLTFRNALYITSLFYISALLLVYIFINNQLPHIFYYIFFFYFFFALFPILSRILFCQLCQNIFTSLEINNFQV